MGSRLTPSRRTQIRMPTVGAAADTSGVTSGTSDADLADGASNLGEDHPGALSVWRELDPLVKRIFAGVACSAVGHGLTLPFLYIYLTRARHLEASVVGLVIAYMGLLGFVLAPVGGNLIDRFGPRPVMIMALVIEASGTYALGRVESVQQALLVLTVVVSGSVGLWPAATAMMTRLVPEVHRETVYGLQFMVMNAGIGIGGVASSVLVPQLSVAEFQRLYVIDGTTFLVYLLVVVSLPRGTGRMPTASSGVADAGADAGPAEPVVLGEPASAGALPARTAGWADVVRDRAALRVVGTSLLVLIFGYAQFEIGFPAYATGVAGVRADRLGWAFAANTLVIVAAQVIALRFIRGRRRSAMLALCAATWCVAWTIVASAALVPGWPAVAAIILGLAIFGLGETLWAPVAPALINALAPEELRGRYNALQGMTWTVSAIIGPALSGLLLGHGLPGVWVSATLGGTALGALLLWRLRVHLTAAQDGLL